VDKKLVATPIPPDQPEAPRLIVRIAGVCLVVGVLTILGGVFWPTIGSWLSATSTLTFLIAFFLLVPYWRPAIDLREQKIHKLYGRYDANQLLEQRTRLQRNELDG
jgi:hypothetical protein